MIQRSLAYRVSLSLGIPDTLGRIVKVFFSGDEKITDSMYFEKCVESYSRALSNAGVRSIFKVLEIVKGTHCTLITPSPHFIELA